MAKFIMVYHGGRSSHGAEKDAERMTRFREWMGSVGKALISPANPTGPSKLVSADGVSDGQEPDVLNGYTVIEAENLEAAVEIAQRCPFTEVGTIEVAELLHMGSKA